MATASKKMYLTDEDKEKLHAILIWINEAYPFMTEREKGRFEGRVEEIRDRAMKSSAQHR